MADSSYEKGISELAKMKVADLKVELKQRGLPTTGNKTELVERLHLADHGALSLDETTDEILDEDAVLGDEEIEELSSKPDSQESGEKRKLSTDSNPSVGKKIILNRNSVIEEVKIDETKKNDESSKDSSDGQSEKKIIKLSELGVKERLEMRAKKFGVSLTDTAKKEVRSARFNAGSESNGKSAASVKTPVHTSYEVLKKRAERFGTNVSTVMEKAQLEERIEKRKARFGEVKPLPNQKAMPSRVKIVK